jgi:hypothetical protein
VQIDGKSGSVPESQIKEESEVLGDSGGQATRKGTRMG